MEIILWENESLGYQKEYLDNLLRRLERVGIISFRF